MSKFAALIASISFPGPGLVDPMPNIETNVSSSIVSGIIIPEDKTSAFFSAIFLGELFFAKVFFRRVFQT